MITVTEYKGQDVGVFGLGKAGEATIAALLAGGAKVWAWDDSEESVKKMSARYGDEVQASSFDTWPWTNIKALVLSPGVPLTHPKPHKAVEKAMAARCPIIGDIELLYRAQPEARYIGITGTNGKSTTTTLIGHILKSGGRNVEVGGNLGMPALSLAPLGVDGTYVLELSSYQLDLVRSTRFNTAVWLNISPDHIDRHGTLENYVRAKEYIFARQRKEDAAVIGIDDERSKTVADMLKYVSRQRVIEISARAKVPGGIYVENGVLHDATGEAPQRFDLNTIITLTGRHNWQNAAAAYAAARAAGLAPEAIYQAMQAFAGLRHRLQLVATINGVRFINDSKATNADATAYALEPYDTIYWIAGGKPKEGGIVPLEKYFPRVRHAFLIGEAEGDFALTLEGKVSYTRCGALKEAVRQAAEKAFAEHKQNAVVLLSPACASFDQWKNFEERGDAFCAMVEALEANDNGGKRHAV